MDKLYETQSYLTECSATVISCTADVSSFETSEFGENRDFSQIRLDRSIFFPEEGGQYADTGRLITADKEEIRLLDGQIVNGEVVYLIDRSVREGETVHCVLDWDTRYDRMQNHSGEHVLTGMVHNRYGFNNVGFHLSDEGFVTLDFDGVLSLEEVLEMEKEANSVIYKDVPIKDSYPTKGELANITYRSKIEIDGQVRLITIGDDKTTYDVCACCAPHVATTGEIGIIKVLSVINFKKGIQVSILCGRRALLHINKQQAILTEISRTLSTADDKTVSVIKSHIEEIVSLKSKLANAQEGRIIDSIEGVKGISDDAAKCIFTDEDLTAINMKNIFNVLAEKFEGYVGVFVGNDEIGYRYNAGSRSLDAKELAAVMNKRLGAKGGGSSEMIQGRVGATRAEIERIFV